MYLLYGLNALLLHTRSSFSPNRRSCVDCTHKQKEVFRRSGQGRQVERGQPADRQFCSGTQQQQSSDTTELLMTSRRRHVSNFPTKSGGQGNHAWMETEYRLRSGRADGMCFLTSVDARSQSQFCFRCVCCEEVQCREAGICLCMVPGWAALATASLRPRTGPQ